MRELIENFPNQIKEAGESLKNQDSNLHDSEAKDFAPDGVLILGMGGSGIGGAFISSILRKTSSIPIQTNPDYCIPGWVSENTLVVACSNSGNTEETLSCFSLAVLKSKKVISITTGGSLENESLKHEVPVVKIPKGFQPRAALGFSLISLLCVFNKINLLNTNSQKIANAQDIPIKGRHDLCNIPDIPPAVDLASAKFISICWLKILV